CARTSLLGGRNSLFLDSW
nr:immunoglobulin heavy chain junction region [Macaca mulatta]MOV47554.1 immunoglobulin heavy chain junction region [Macaca mulatta]MOV47628.1 immunoglobulin heavy chain junction region [Macaca mulatta]MOV47781.1 immunoglobulin heavy chain junction region [Macaca mulatta]MOV47814.1 immunoglobulin heavy chain junction region [Macaca mulatta]